MLRQALNACAAIALVLASLSHVDGATLYSEFVSGDLSNNGLNPTPLSFTSGSNEVFGTTGRDSAGVSDRDYFTFTVPSNLKLTALIEEAGTQTTSLGFFAVQNGTQVTVSPTTTTAAGLLGWIHYGPAATDIDILPELGIPSQGSTGFVPPLAPGSYAFWLQDTTAGTFNYRFNFILAAVPEPSAGFLLIFGLLGLWRFLRLRID